MPSFPRRPPRLPRFDYGAPRTYFVTFCTRHRRRSFSDPSAARVACDVLLRYRAAGKFFLYAFCVMPDHVHMLLKLRESARSLSVVIAAVKASIRHDLSPVHHVSWSEGYYDRIKRDYEDTSEMVKYILANPRRAGIDDEEGAYAFMGQPDSWI